MSADRASCFPEESRFRLNSDVNDPNDWITMDGYLWLYAILCLVPPLFDQYLYIRQLKVLKNKDVPDIFKEAYEKKVKMSEANK